jgi:hypothetical protein
MKKSKFTRIIGPSPSCLRANDFERDENLSSFILFRSRNENPSGRREGGLSPVLDIDPRPGLPSKGLERDYCRNHQKALT